MILITHELTAKVDNRSSNYGDWQQIEIHSHPKNCEVEKTVVWRVIF